MPRKKKPEPLQMGRIELGGMFPFDVTVLYKKGVPIHQTITDAAADDEDLAPLADFSDEGPGSFLSVVYRVEGTTAVYIVVDDRITVDTIVHESVHLVCRLFEIIGSVLSDDTEELFAYLQTFLFKEVYKIVTEVYNIKPPMIFEGV